MCLGTVDVYLSYHGKGPGLFYVQRADTTNQIQQIMREIANLVKTSPIPLTEPPRYLWLLKDKTSCISKSFLCFLLHEVKEYLILLVVEKFKQYNSIFQYWFYKINIKILVAN